MNKSQGYNTAVCWPISHLGYGVHCCLTAAGVEVAHTEARPSVLWIMTHMNVAVMYCMWAVSESKAGVQCLRDNLVICLKKIIKYLRFVEVRKFTWVFKNLLTSHLYSECKRLQRGAHETLWAVGGHQCPRRQWERGGNIKSGCQACMLLTFYLMLILQV